MAAKARIRHSYSQLFMDKLTELSEGQQKLIGNGALQVELGWDSSRYERIKGQLVDENAIIVGRGRGGSNNERGECTASPLRCEL